MLDKVRINVGGVRFETNRETLSKFPGTKLATLQTASHNYDDRNGEFFFDRNPHIFSFILEAYRTGELHIPKDTCGRIIKKEIEFWGLSPANLSECCWKSYYKSDSNLSVITDLTRTYYTNTNMCHMMTGQDQTAKMKLWMFLDEPRSSKQAKVWSAIMMSVVSLSTLCLAIQTLPQCRQQLPVPEIERAQGFLLELGFGNGTNIDDWFGPIHPVIFVLDIICFVFITADVILRLLSCPSLGSFFQSCLNLADIICVVSFWLTKGLERNLKYLENRQMFTLFIVAETIVIIKIMRFCRLYRQIPALNVLALSIKSSKSEIAVLAVILLILVNIFGYMMFCAEFVVNDRFRNAFAAMYWAVITLTTVGYGDFHPSTPQGHVIAAACSICGVLMLALPIGVIAASFNNLYAHHKYAMNHIEAHKLTSAAGNVCKVNFKQSRRKKAKNSAKPQPRNKGTNEQEGIQNPAINF